MPVLSHERESLGVRSVSNSPLPPIAEHQSFVPDDRLFILGSSDLRRVSKEVVGPEYGYGVKSGLRKQLERVTERMRDSIFRNAQHFAKISDEYSTVSEEAAVGRGGEGDAGAGHVGRYISLANPDRASALMCHVPAIITFTLLAGFLTALLHSYEAYIYMFLFLTMYMLGWVAYMSVFAWFGMYNIRQAVKHDWNQQWEEFIAANPGADQGLLHFVIFPNYQEDEDMLGQTLANVALSNMASQYMVVVLAMEAREEGAKDKAERLMEKYGSNFKDMIATYHPANIPNEVKGKSSNTQWAYREVQRYYGSHVSSQANGVSDPSKVFLTVADADSIHEPQYWASMSLKALAMPAEQRAWTMYQPPILLLRNYETVPQLVRTGAYGTFLFEISGLASSKLFDHMCFSAYSLPLALANHPLVEGWDADVIAEDHHMFMKCMCANYWEQLFSNETNRSVVGVSKLQLEPIWLPVTSYLVEDSEGGALASIYARYQQARRHMQGIAEMAYILLQHWSIASQSRQSIPFRAHLQLFQLCIKYINITILNALHAALCIVTVMVGVFILSQTLFSGASTVDSFADGFHRFQELRHEKPLYGMLVFILQFYAPLITLMIVSTNFLVVKDSVEGRYCPLFLQKLASTEARELKKASKLKYRAMNRLGSGDTMELQSEEDEGAAATTTDDVNNVDLEAGLGGKSGYGKMLHTSESEMAALYHDASEEKVALVSRKLTCRQQVKLFAQIYTDLNLMGQLTCIVYGTIPLIQTVVSLSRFGHKFDYIVAAKPKSLEETMVLAKK